MLVHQRVNITENANTNHSSLELKSDTGLGEPEKCQAADAKFGELGQ